MKAFLLDIDYETGDTGTDIKLYLKSKNGIKVVTDKTFDPYFYCITNVPEELEKALGKKVKKVEKLKDGVVKITVFFPRDVPDLRLIAAKFGDVREADIFFTRRYLIDNDIQPGINYEWTVKNGKVSKGPAMEAAELKAIAYDLETYNPERMSDSSRDPIIMISTFDEKEGRVLTWKKINQKFVTTLKGEQECIDQLTKYCTKGKYDIIYTYNGDNFDCPYIKERAKISGAEKPISPTGESITLRKGIRGLKARIPGMAHIDAYRGMRFLAYIGALKLIGYTLENVYKEMLGKDKVDVDGRYIYKIWDEEKELENFALYSYQDSEATFELGEYMRGVYQEFSKLLNQTLYDVSRMTPSEIVELLLFKISFSRHELAPNKPAEGEYAKRIRAPIKGAFVKQPESGLHENLAVVDFRGLYPSIIIAHNVGPDTLNCDCCAKPHQSPIGHKFCKKKTGVIPEMLNHVIERRMKIKKEMKALDKNSKEWKHLWSEQMALKIIANSTYGYLLYARSRWYTREGGEATTAWGRDYIQKAMAEAEKEGFEVLYGDTDSLFLKLKNKKKVDVQAFLKKFNKELPEEMELELEGFYPRGIFVTKKEGGAAKKRYALINEDGGLEIKGLEFVRRDWSALAKRTQEKVIRAVLQGEVEKAVKLAKKTIEDLRSGKVPLDDLVIRTSMTRRIDKYENKGPHVRAAMRLEESGEKVSKGALIEFIVVKGAGNIGDRSYPVQLIGNREPDVEYYINNQVMPAVMKILHELGVKEEDLKVGGKQKSLEGWF